MKRLSCFILAVVLSCSYFSVAQAGEPAVGTIIDHVISTDIKAYINGSPIPSMNIRGKTAIVVEDLRRYGFHVDWSPTQKTLKIAENPNKPLYPIPDAGPSGQVGSVVGDVLYSDIRVYLNAEPIESFNINGRSAIFIDELARLGDVGWNAQERKISFVSAAAHHAGQAEAQKPSESFRIARETERRESLLFRDGSYMSGDRKVGEVIAATPFVLLAYLADAFGYKLQNAASGKSVVLSDDQGYSFELSDLPLMEQLMGLIQATNAKQPVPQVTRNYLFALQTAQEFASAWAHRDAERGLSWVTDAWKQRNDTTDLGAAFRGTSNPHHMTYELSGKRKVDDQTYLFDVHFYEYYTGQSDSINGLPADRRIGKTTLEVIKQGENEWGEDIWRVNS